MLSFSSVVDFYLFYDGLVDMLIRALLPTRQCRVSNIKVPVKARGPFVILFHYLIQCTCTLFKNRVSYFS